MGSYNCCTPAAHPQRGPLTWSGNFAVVFKLIPPQGGGDAWAVKCFTRWLDDLQTRYSSIGDYLNKLQGSTLSAYFVPFEYQQKDILVNGRWFPIVKMPWIHGKTLKSYLEPELRQPNTFQDTFGSLSRLWWNLARELEAGQIAHGDLQHDNVLFQSSISPTSSVH